MYFSAMKLLPVKIFTTNSSFPFPPIAPFEFLAPSPSSDPLIFANRSLSRHVFGLFFWPSSSESSPKVISWADMWGGALLLFLNAFKNSESNLDLDCLQRLLLNCCICFVFVAVTGTCWFVILVWDVTPLLPSPGFEPRLFSINLDFDTLCSFCEVSAILHQRVS